jgi:hypothetical protein
MIALASATLMARRGALLRGLARRASELDVEALERIRRVDDTTDLGVEDQERPDRGGGPPLNFYERLGQRRCRSWEWFRALMWLAFPGA